MVTINDLRFNYSRNQQPLFENPDCALQAGSIVGLLGKNGAGTALLKLMTGLLRRTEGKVCIMGYQPIKINRLNTVTKFAENLPLTKQLPQCPNSVIQTILNLKWGSHPAKKNPASTLHFKVLLNTFIGKCETANSLLHEY